MGRYLIPRGLTFNFKRIAWASQARLGQASKQSFACQSDFNDFGNGFLGILFRTKRRKVRVVLPLAADQKHALAASLLE